MTPAEQIRLVLAAQAGDVAARNAYVLGIERLVYRRALHVRRVYTRHDPDDLAQIGLVRVLEKIHYWDQTRRYTPNTYFGYIAWRAMLDYARTESVITLPRQIGNPRRQAARDRAAQVVHLSWQPGGWGAGDPDLSNIEPALPAPDLAADLERAEQAARLHRLIGTLPVQWRLAAQAELDQKTLRQAGAEMGLSSTRVAQLQLKAKRRLAQLWRRGEGI